MRSTTLCGCLKNCSARNKPQPNGGNHRRRGCYHHKDYKVDCFVACVSGLSLLALCIGDARNNNFLSADLLTIEHTPCLRFAIHAQSWGFHFYCSTERATAKK